MRSSTLASLFGLSVMLALSPSVPADIVFIGKASIPGNTADKSGLTDLVGDKVPHNRLGAFGSAIDYTGQGDLYLAVTDRGPGDGAAAYHPRLQTFRIAINPGSERPVEVELVATTILTDPEGRPFSGFSGHLDPSGPERLDPEGLRLSRSGTLFIAEEYGPFIDEFSRDGKRLRRLPVPETFTIAHPAADPRQEQPPRNTSGRMPNRGFEGLALGPDGRTIWTMVQSPLIQDGALGPDGKRAGRHCRILELNIDTGQSRQWIYTLDSPRHGVSEILCISDRELLVLERDGEGGKDARSRQIYKVDVSRATDVSGAKSLPSGALPANIRAGTKTLWLDLMDPRFGLAGAEMPEKIEGLCFGPTLPDGRRTLIITSDNDMKPDQPSWFWVFAFGS
ncbi:MAG: esterase-like activity of phytase family protein [Phycisphaerales bacterium]